MKSTTPIIRPLKADDVPLVLSDLKSTTLRGFVAEIGGEIVGVMGVYHGREAPVAFSQLSDKLRKHPKTIVHAIRLFRQLLEQHYTCVYAAASKDEASTFRTLARAGFSPYTKSTDQHRGLWVWQIPSP